MIKSFSAIIVTLSLSDVKISIVSVSAVRLFVHEEFGASSC